MPASPPHHHQPRASHDANPQRFAGRGARARTLELHLEARLAAEDRDLSVVALVHERAEHRARRRAVRVTD